MVIFVVIGFLISLVAITFGFWEFIKAVYAAVLLIGWVIAVMIPIVYLLLFS
jgi:hypothetical protein